MVWNGMGVLLGLSCGTAFRFVSALFLFAYNLPVYGHQELALVFRPASGCGLCIPPPPHRQIYVICIYWFPSENIIEVGLGLGSVMKIVAYPKQICPLSLKMSNNKRTSLLLASLCVRMPCLGHR